MDTTSWRGQTRRIGFWYIQQRTKKKGDNERDMGCICGVAIAIGKSTSMPWAIV